MMCEVCGKDIKNGEEVLRVENSETKEVVVVHKDCLDKMGIA